MMPQSKQSSEGIFTLNNLITNLSRVVILKTHDDFNIFVYTTVHTNKS